MFSTYEYSRTLLYCMHILREEYLGMFVLASRENTAGEKEETAIISRLTRDSTLETNIYI